MPYERAPIENPVREQGLVPMDAGTYLRDPVPEGSVSSTALKILWEQSPAHCRHYLDHGRAPKIHYDEGSAVHALALGEGRELAVWDGDSWRGKEAEAFRAAAYAEDKIPILRKSQESIEGMVAAIRRHRLLGKLLTPGKFTAEQAAFWIDDDTELWCRAMFDAVPDFSSVMKIVDLKSCLSCSGDAVSKAVLNYRYDMQAAHYTAGARALGLAEQVVFLLAFVEKDPPHVIRVAPIGERTATFAAQHRREALRIYRDCRESGIWPGYDGVPTDDYDLEPIEVPYWALRKWDHR